MPTPNGYDTFVRVGKELVKITVPDLSMPGSITKQSLAAFKRQSDGLLAQAHEALDQECQCLAFSEETWQQSWLPEIQAIRELARGFAVQGYTAHMNSEDNKAIECYLATVRMGKASSRGGLYIDALVGIACEGIGLNHLHDLQTSLSEEQLLELAQTLCSMQELNEPLEVIAARDEVADYYICGWVGRLQLMLEKISQPDDLFSKKLMGIALQRRQSQYQILLIEIALTRYHNKHGIYPQKLDALVPDFLGELPKEPHGADGFIYRLKETQSNVTNQPPYELYSPGPNLLDDGGNPNTTNNSFDDISFSR
ncbi:MAG: hypothetical protein JXM70_23410 [Pirellulales bacterium]|nr:hypothetical protein [Pirellulales bacterium]